MVKLIIFGVGRDCANILTLLNRDNVEIVAYLDDSTLNYPHLR